MTAFYQETWVASDIAMLSTAKMQCDPESSTHICSTENRVIVAYSHTDSIRGLVPLSVDASISYRLWMRNFAQRSISARKGVFESELSSSVAVKHGIMRCWQTKTLGIQRLVVVINKIDEAKWVQSRFDECCDKLRPLSSQTGCGIYMYIHVYICRVHISDDNLNATRRSLQRYRDRTQTLCI